jgi:hypothetical protein
MSDISMCQNEKCKLKIKCYRYMAVPSSWQTYADFNEENCESFSPIGKHRPLRQIKSEE